jgi:hypothetical protein
MHRVSKALEAMFIVKNNAIELTLDTPRNLNKLNAHIWICLHGKSPSKLGSKEVNPK